MVLLVVYFYVINNAEFIIKDFVNRQSHGRLSVEIKKITFNPGKLHLSIIEPHFYTNHTFDQPTDYDIKAKSLELDLSSLKPLIFERKIFLDTIVCMRPQITIAKWKKTSPKKTFRCQSKWERHTNDWIQCSIHSTLNTA